MEPTRSRPGPLRTAVATRWASSTPVHSLDLPDIGFDPEVLNQVSRVISECRGCTVPTPPTGSGLEKHGPSRNVRSKRAQRGAAGTGRCALASCEIQAADAVPAISPTRSNGEAPAGSSRRPCPEWFE